MIEILPTDDNRQLKFKVNHKRLKEANLKVDSKVLQLALEIRR